MKHSLNSRVFSPRWTPFTAFIVADRIQTTWNIEQVSTVSLRIEQTSVLLSDKLDTTQNVQSIQCRSEISTPISSCQIVRVSSMDPIIQTRENVSTFRSGERNIKIHPAGGES